MAPINEALMKWNTFSVTAGKKQICCNCLKKYKKVRCKTVLYY